MRIEISTAAGRVFEGEATVVEFRTDAGMCVEIRPRQGNYFNMIRDGKLSLKTDVQLLHFLIQGASANLSKGRLTILAMTVCRSEEGSESSPQL